MWIKLRVTPIAHARAFRFQILDFIPGARGFGSCHFLLSTCPTEKTQIPTSRHAGIAISGNPKNNCQPITSGRNISTTSCNAKPTW